MSRNKQNPAAVVEHNDATPGLTTAELAVVSATDDDAIDAALAAIEAGITPAAPLEAETIEIDLTSDPAIIDPVADEVAEVLEGIVEAGDENVTEEAADETTVEAGDTTTDETEGDVEVIDADIDATLAALAADDEQKPAAAKPGRKASTPKAPKQPKAPATPKRDFHSIAAIDAATLKANLDGCKAIKVNEKAQNLIQAVEAGKKLSRYTSVAIQDFVAKGKTSGKDLVGTFTDAGLSLGTARAQAQQMTALFKMTGLAAPAADNDRELVIADAKLAQELVSLAA